MTKIPSPLNAKLTPFVMRLKWGVPKNISLFRQSVTLCWSRNSLLLPQFPLVSSPGARPWPWPCSSQSSYSSQPTHRAASPQPRHLGLPEQGRTGKPAQPHSPRADLWPNSLQQPALCSRKSQTSGGLVFQRTHLLSLQCFHMKYKLEVKEGNAQFSYCWYSNQNYTLWWSCFTKSGKDDLLCEQEEQEQSTHRACQPTHHTGFTHSILPDLLHLFPDCDLHPTDTLQ